MHCRYVLQVQDGCDIEECEGTTDDLEKGKKKKLDMVRWIAAFQCYALAAEAVGVHMCVHAFVFNAC